jgi:hypothetical protein
MPARKHRKERVRTVYSFSQCYGMFLQPTRGGGKKRARSHCLLLESVLWHVSAANRGEKKGPPVSDGADEAEAFARIEAAVCVLLQRVSRAYVNRTSKGTCGCRPKEAGCRPTEAGCRPKEAAHRREKYIEREKLQNVTLCEKTSFAVN